MDTNNPIFIVTYSTVFVILLSVTIFALARFVVEVLAKLGLL